MRLCHLKDSLRRRMTNPAYWVAGGMLAVLPMTSLLLMSRDSGRWGALFGLGVLGLACLPALWLCPVPFQWTGDDRPLAGWLRGLCQAVPFAAIALSLWVVVIWLTMRFFGHAPPARASNISGFCAGMGTVGVMVLLPVGFTISRMERLGIEAREAKARAREVQWMGQRGAFSPRLVFSSLQHLADLASQDARGTEQGLVELATLYRQWLLEAEKPLLDLASERAISEQYVALESARWSGMLNVRWHLDLDHDGYLVPSLILLQTLEGLLAASSRQAPVFLDICTRVHEGAESHLELLVGASASLARPSEPLMAALRDRLGPQGELAWRPQSKGWELVLCLPCQRMCACSSSLEGFP